ncbi:hypothetical protein BDR07DRAFT_1349213, partial [Suillus spraguei]
MKHGLIHWMASLICLFSFSDIDLHEQHVVYNHILHCCPQTELPLLALHLHSPLCAGYCNVREHLNILSSCPLGSD